MAKKSLPNTAPETAERAAERPRASVSVAESDGSLLGTVAGLAVASLLVVARLTARVWHAITADGALAAAGRQGLDELGGALKALPDSLSQANAQGTVWHPLPSELAASRQSYPGGSYQSFSHTPPHPWPSEIARENQGRSDPGYGHEHEHDNDHSL